MLKSRYEAGRHLIYETNEATNAVSAIRRLPSKLRAHAFLVILSSLVAIYGGIFMTSSTHNVVHISQVVSLSHVVAASGVSLYDFVTSLSRTARNAIPTKSYTLITHPLIVTFKIPAFLIRSQKLHTLCVAYPSSASLPPNSNQPSSVSSRHFPRS